MVDQGAVHDMFDPVLEARRAFDKFDQDKSGSLNIRCVISILFAVID